MPADRPPPRPSRPPPLPARALSRAPEWVGEADWREDVSKLSDRTLNLRALHEVLCLRHDFGRAMGELGDLSGRVKALEGSHGPDRATEPNPRASSHEWDTLMALAGQALSERVKDPRDKLDSNRARAIAREAIEQARTAEDAGAFRKWKTRGWAVAFEVAKYVVSIIVGGLAVHYGLHGGAP